MLKHQSLGKREIAQGEEKKSMTGGSGLEEAVNEDKDVQGPLPVLLVLDVSSQPLLFDVSHPASLTVVFSSFRHIFLLLSGSGTNPMCIEPSGEYLNVNAARGDGAMI